jgi:peptidyl-tRNA hydrolase, PTH1 family
LGNPGPRYEKTRHNAGFLVLEAIRRGKPGAGTEGRPGAWIDRGDRQETTVLLAGGSILLCRPLTFMNLSGTALDAFLAAHGLAPDEVLVVLDDVALPEGRLRLRPTGGAGGHKGLISILDCIGSAEIPRLRVGVGEPLPGVEMVDFVLEPLTGPAWDRLERIAAAAARAAVAAVVEGIGPTMNQFNSVWVEGFLPEEAPGRDEPDAGGNDRG